MALRKDLRILVVDDMSVSRQILVQMLETIGIASVLTEIDGFSALASLVSQPADVVIADLNMPGMDGLELLFQLRQDRRFSKIGFVMTSGDESNEKIDIAWQNGLDRFLSKPFDINRLIACLETVTGRV
ncbi:MAG: response regulator [Paracoccaceae bacterium]